ncbi:hypothetical protein SAMN05443662_0729 [Sulfurivirga caldicuralii]|uniref:Class I SAM-dependent methyltransferase n=1 Tax=Sulfurivirga caldicuralii TaxID=364032 RepID=A0A1N6ER96_9GAMM|nr:hypothetical protein [Sulfurivirga caldicuralii]SIN85507.1 hypothetical protein SAMN05443662_0729 [Sulfurivirga caldicuralii]
MLAEWLQYWTTWPAVPQARSLGYLYEAIALQARRHRCAGAWSAHYARCRQAMEALNAQPGSRWLILGGGLLEDIPLEWLDRQGVRVDVVDIVFLRRARRRLRGYKQVHLLERDVTEHLHQLVQGDFTPPVPSWGLDRGYDVVVSLNLATQLPLLPAQYLLKQGIKDDAIDAYGRALMRAHLTYLQRFPGAEVLLIADRHIESLDRGGRVVDEIDPWWGETPPPAETHWQWEAVPLREGGGRGRRVHTVGVSRWRNP